VLQIYDRIIRWWVLCALVRECIASTAALQCKIRGRDTYANCHRFDQSALNILAVHHFAYNDEVYYYNGAGILTVERLKLSANETLHICQYL